MCRCVRRAALAASALPATLHTSLPLLPPPTPPPPAAVFQGRGRVVRGQRAAVRPDAGRAADQVHQQGQQRVGGEGGGREGVVRDARCIFVLPPCHPLDVRSVGRVVPVGTMVVPQGGWVVVVVAAAGIPTGMVHWVAAVRITRDTRGTPPSSPHGTR